jgi:hypothetical protein
MRRSSLSWLACTLVATGVLVGGAGSGRAADDLLASNSLAGNWKVVVLSSGSIINVWLVKIEGKGGKLKGELLSAGLQNFKQSKLDKFRADSQGVHLTFRLAGNEFEVVAHPPRGQKTPKLMLGSVSVGGQMEFVRLERTEDKELDAEKRPEQSEAGKAYFQAIRIQDKDERTKALKDIVTKHPKDPLAFNISVQLLSMAANEKDVKEEEVRSQADKALKIVAPYGPAMELQSFTQMAQVLMRSKKLASLAVDYARKAEKLLPESAPPSTRANVLRTLATALQKAGKKDEAKDVKTQLAKLDKVLDEEFLKTAIPFKPKMFEGRKAKSDRAAVVELFTGAQCPPCVAADVAFDGMIKTYKPRDVILLQYHLHIPGPDPLTNKETEARAKYYKINYTPFLLVNGKQVEGVGGGKQNGKAMYDKVRTTVDEQLEEKPQGGLKLTADRKGDTIELTADVSGLKKTGDDVRLRFVIVEDVARYLGRNGQRLHHHVVRALPGGLDGMALTKKSGQHKVTVDLKEVAKGIEDYLKGRNFEEDDRRLGLKHLKAVALIQDNDSKEILQATQVNLSEDK